MITMLQRKAEFVFFPLMKSMDLEGWVNIVYFPPNNWEYLDKKPKYLYLIYPNGAKWKTVFLEKITFSKLECNELNPESLSHCAVTFTLTTTVIRKISQPKRKTAEL